MSNRQFQHNMSNLRGLLLSMTSSRHHFLSVVNKIFPYNIELSCALRNCSSRCKQLSSPSFFLPELCPHVRQCTCALLHNGLQHPIYLVCNKREYLAHNHSYAIPMLMHGTNCHIIHRSFVFLKNKTIIFKNY